MSHQQPQSYADMFQAAMRELKRQTDLYFEFKKKEFDEYVDNKLEEKYGTITKED